MQLKSLNLLIKPGCSHTFGHAVCLLDTLQAYRSNMHPVMSILFHRVLVFYCIEMKFHHVLLDGMSNGAIFNPNILTSGSNWELT